MSDSLRPHPSGPTPELARYNPEAFKAQVLFEMANRSTYGAAIWNKTTDAGVVDASQLTINPATWVSRSKGSGEIQLGAAPMDTTTKERLFFQAERFSYADEVAYRLLHETVHGLLYLSQHSAETNRLRTATHGVRSATGGEKGLTALGSLPFYTGANKATEDATELMTMFAWDPDYAKEFTDFLADTRYETVRNEVGLATLHDSDTLYSLISQAVRANI